MGAVITSSANFHIHSLPAYHWAMHALSAAKESGTVATMVRHCSIAVVTVAAVAVLIQAATPFYNSRMVSAYLEAEASLEAAPYITVMPAD